MRIAYVLKKFPRLSETFILNEILGLERRGHELTIFSLREPDAEPTHKALSQLNAPVITIPKNQSVPDDSLDKRLRTYFELLPRERRERHLGQAHVIRRLCDEHRIEHVHAHFMTIASQVSSLCRLLGGPPVTVTAHAKDIFRRDINEDLFRSTSAIIAGLVTVSRFNSRFINERFFGGKKDDISIVYNGLPFQALGRQHEAADRSRNLVLGVGRLVEKKGFDAFIRVAKRVRETIGTAQFKIIGGGECEAGLRRLIDQVGAQSYVELLGPLPSEEVVQWMKRARILLAPCQEGTDGNRDALPTVLIEALACGLPAVSTQMVGIPEIIQHEETGLLTEPGDEDAMAGAVTRLLQDTQLWARCHQKSPVAASARFDQNHTLANLEQVFQACAQAGVNEAS